ncbi:MAG: hypothetical protein ACLUOI_19080 [Eisenbergiella sp.]
MGSAVEAVYRIIDNKVERWIFREKGFQGVDVPLSQLKLKKNLLLCNIIRRERPLPSGRD